MDDQVKRLAEKLLHTGFDTLSERDQRVLKRMAQRAHISRDIGADFERRLSFGERLADSVAEFGGSWTFIIIFGLVLAAWVLLNSGILAGSAFDPFPFIFLNLMLSMLAAIQAPVIMMSQNRYAVKDRLAAAHDYEVNLKAELEIMALHDKLDQIRNEEISALISEQQRQLKLLMEFIERPGAT
ncbi:MAG TPA: DUF1003 domain-containing protein [Nordella sp.]|nr:DUF1003 domain-containing protein [Nordella sp.]